MIGDMKSRREEAQKVAKVTKDRDVRIHADLWHTSKCLLERGQEQKKASVPQFKASLVFTAFSLEAYLNWLGSKLFPHWTYLKRLGPKEKLALISNHVGVKIHLGRRPWQIVKTLFGFRNVIAHGESKPLKSEIEETIDDDLDERLGNFTLSRWENFCTCENAERTRVDVEQIAQELLAAAKLENESYPSTFGMQFTTARVGD
jgi:hypothetical protein